MFSSGRWKVPKNFGDYQVRPDGLLYDIVENPHGKLVYQVIVPKDFREGEVRLAHSLPMSGHEGVLASLV